MGTRFPGVQAGRRRPGTGRHTSLIGREDDDSPQASYPTGDGLPGQGTRVYIRGEDGRGAWPDGPGYRPGGLSSGSGGYQADTVVMGDLGLFNRGRTAEWPKVGVNREPPPRPWYQSRVRIAIVAAGLAAVAFGGFVGVPALLQALGVGPGTQDGLCPTCQFPIPSSAAVPPGPGSSAAAPATPSATAPAKAATAGPATPPPPVAAAPQPPTTPAGQTMSPLSVIYRATPGNDGQFTGQVTVVNRTGAAVTNWQLVVALPYDTVSAVQNAEISDQNDVLYLSPAPGDLSIPPGGTVVVTIFASGPTTSPAACSFNNVACQ